MSAVQKIEPQAQAVATARLATPMEMLAAAIERGMPPETVDKFMSMAERWQANQERMAFNAAIAAAKAEIPVITKNRAGHNNKAYADFSAYARTVDPILGKHGLGYRFRTVQDDKTIRVTCILFHKDGHSEDNTLAGGADQTGNKNAIQAIGSTLTYLQRYTLVQALGLAASEDDDGKAAGNGGPINAEQAQTIRDKIDEIDVVGTEARLLRWARVDAIEDIPASKYEAAVANLNTVKRS